jgi:iron complex outermembrane receptor protein
LHPHKTANFYKIFLVQLSQFVGCVLHIISLSKNHFFGSFIAFIFVIFSALLAQPTFAENARTLKPIIITASPLGHSANELLQPTTMLFGDELFKKLQPTIGETLSQEVGIRSTNYGPNASRPIIRGLGGDQIQILQNGIGNIDASAASVDHNVSIDPLSVERIEVIRGPAALLYGSKAVGGVINIIDNRIPDERISEKITGIMDGRLNSANKERSGSILMEGGMENYAWHINGFKRVTGDLNIPGFARSKHLRREEPLASGEDEASGKLENSQSDSKGGTFGISKFFKKGYFGVALTDYDSNYGAVAEPDVTIGMKQQRVDLAGAYKEPLQYIKEVKYKLGVSNYKHTEFEGSEAGTVFKNAGYDSRVEILHNKLGIFEGAVGLQSGASDFSAVGDEAFLPPTTTRTNSGFILEEMSLGNIGFQLGGRFDYQEINANKASSFDHTNSRNDLTGSGSTGLVYHPARGYAVAISGSYTQRAPNAQELYAKGPHLATNSFEVGDENLNIQQSKGLDVSFRKELGNVTGEINFFYNRFHDFIASVATGSNDPTLDLPIYSYANLSAEFYGAEIKTEFTTYYADAHKFIFEARGDYVEARNTKTKEPLPRISPLRVGGSAIYRYQKIGLRMDADYTFAQNRVSQFERPTDGYMMMNATVDYAMNIGATTSTIYFKTINLLNEEARNHTSFLKNIAPLAGRSIMIGIRRAF